MINWKIRFKNPMFYVQLIFAVLTPVLAYKGITAQDLTSWAVLGKIFLEAVKNPYVLALVAVCHSRKNRHQKALKNGMNRRNSFDFSPPGRIYSTVHLTTSLCRHDILAKERNIPKGSSPWHKPIMSAPHCQATFAA